MIRIIKLLRNTRGVATIEFSLASLFLFGIIMVALDFGYNVQQKLKLGNAVEQGAILAYNLQTGSTTGPITSYISAAAGTKAAPNVAITCNGTSTCGDGKCSCINSSGAFTQLGACNVSCGTNAISGNYMKIVATTTYNSVIVPDKYLGGSTITSSAVVRLQ